MHARSHTHYSGSLSRITLSVADGIRSESYRSCVNYLLLIGLDGAGCRVDGQDGGVGLFHFPVEVDRQTRQIAHGIQPGRLRVDAGRLEIHRGVAVHQHFGLFVRTVSYHLLHRQWTTYGISSILKIRQNTTYCNSDAPGSSSSLSTARGWRRVQLNRLSSRYRELGPSSEDGLSLSAVPTCGTVFLHLSAPSTPTRSSAVLSKLICSSLRLIINCFYFLFNHFWLCNARSAGFYLVWLGTITFYHIIS